MDETQTTQAAIRALIQAKGKASIASDYAVLSCSNGMEFYYGYEVTIGSEDNPEWCFEGRWNGRKFQIPFSELGLDKNMKFEVTECLLAGLGKWIALRFPKPQSTTPSNPK